jgi:capsular exopolysaccharide synthesis family protein
MSLAEPLRATGALIPAQQPTQPVPGTGPSAPTASDLVKALRRRWLPACTAGILVAVVTFTGLWLGLPEGKYTATSIVFVPVNAPHLAFREMQSAQDFTVLQQGQKALVKTRLVLSNALKDPEICNLSFLRNVEDPVEYLQTKMKVDYSTGPEYLTIALAQKNPQEATNLVQAVTNAYLKEAVGKEKERRNKRLDQLKKLLQEFNKNLSRKQETLRTLKLSAGSSDAKVIAAKQQYLAEVAGKVRADLYGVKAELRKLEIELEFGSKEGSPAVVVPESLVEQELIRDPGMMRLLTRKGELAGELAELLPKAKRGREEPALQPLIRDLESVESAVEERRKHLRPLIARELRERARHDNAGRLNEKAERVKILKKLRDSYETELQTYEVKSDAFNVAQVDMEALAQEITQDQKTRDHLAEEEQALKVEVDAPDRVSLFQKAESSRPDETLRRFKISAPSAGGALVLVIGLVSWTEFRRRRLESAKDVQVLGLPVIGTVPARRSAVSWLPFRHLPMPVWQNVMTECVDAVRTHLLHSADTQGARVLMVTSAVPGEGKTSVSTQLAASLARAGRKTLLLDGDIRRPAAHRAYDLPMEPGLCEYLRGQFDLPQVLRQTCVLRLHMISAGLWDQSAVQALAQNELGVLLGKLKEDYDFIVIDSAPVLPVVDSLLIGRHVDGVLFSLMRGISQLAAVESAHHRLTSLNIPLLGAVVNGTELGGYGYGYSYGYAHTSRDPEPGLRDSGHGPVAHQTNGHAAV